ncbi:MAG: DUF4406 domain-containing protein [Bacteroidales bacterium]|jgi:hypothetical protein|nr:DUF4406 domain-containing protein [Bacteroidales bacterium]
MTISKFNSEGYYDPTTYEALSKVEREEKAARYRPLVYICSPFSGDISGNIERAKKYSRYAVDSKAIPIAPHLLFPQFMSDDAERELALFMDMVLLGKCEELWVFGELVTEGMSAEIAKAKRKNMKIRYFTENCEEAD